MWFRKKKKVRVSLCGSKEYSCIFNVQIQAWLAHYLPDPLLFVLVIPGLQH